MPWTHWWDGPARRRQGLGHRGIPSAYVLDPKGIIRYEGLHGEELEKAVNDLLKEMDEKK